ncbi:clathrin adaptor, mu subunit [Hortaea werneckii]|nr:clathrin adaptor, mu subunit [Hortaea werneckii]
MAAIQALYIFDEHNNLILDHTYTTTPRQPPPPSSILPLYLAHPTPRPSTLHLPNLSPPTTCYTITRDALLFVSPSTNDIEPLSVLEFLHRVADALSEFLGSPLLASRITASYDVVAQILGAMADGGVPCESEGNALIDTVETGPGVLDGVLGKIGLPAGSSTPTLQQPGSQFGGGGRIGAPLRPIGGIGGAETAQGSAVPWRRSNVRHTSNELYVDLIEEVNVTLAPSGRALAAFASGSVAFTSRVSGVPDLLLSLTTTGGKGVMGSGSRRAEQLQGVMERVVFHQCVRLNRWKSEGLLSFVPPDGRFALAGYEVDLLNSGQDAVLAESKGSLSFLPASLEVNTGLGAGGAEFEVRCSPPTSAASRMSSASASLQSNLGPSGRGASKPDPKAPVLEELTINVPLPAAVRNVSDLRPTKGEAHWNPADGSVEWKVSGKYFGALGAVLRCTVQGPLTDNDDDGSGGILNGITSTTYDYDDDQPTARHSDRQKSNEAPNGVSQGDEARRERHRQLMPTSATLSFTQKGQLASGLRVESLLIDQKKSRGLGEGVKPYKGVKYLTVSRGGVEVRC